MPWQLQSVRFTAFVMPDVVLPSDLWASVVGGEPETSVYQRAIALRQETGAFLDGRATLNIQPARVDLLLEAAGLPGPTPPTLGPFPDGVRSFIDAVRRWVRSEGFLPVRRLALGMVLVSPAATRELGHEQLREFIDAVPRGEASDFLYQVNRWRRSTSGVENLLVNRLSKWSVTAVQLMMLGAGMTNLGVTHTFVNLELDLSSSAEFSGPIPRDRVEAVIDDLVAAAGEVATRGDRLG